jgi:type II secretory pathway pseudopilin PulG
LFLNDLQSKFLLSRKLEGKRAMMTQTQSLLVSLAIIVVSIAFLAPRIISPTQSVVLLNQTVVLAQDGTEVQYTFALNKGDQLNIQLSGNGDLVNLIIAQSSSPSNRLVDQEEQTVFTFAWTVPQTGSYVFSLSADNGATADIIVTKT